MYFQLLTIFRDVKTVLLFLLGLLLTTYLIKKFSRNPRWVRLSEKLPGPYDLPLVGNTFHFILGAKAVSTWKHKRRAFQPFFTKNHSLSQIPVMNKAIYECIDELKTLVNGPESDWKAALNDLSLKTFSRLYLTLNENPNMDELKNIIYGLSRATEMFSAGAFLNSPTLINVWNWFLSPSVSELNKSIKRYVDEVVDFNKKQARNFAEKETGEENKNSAFVLSFMDTLERIQKELGEEDLIYTEITALLIAGSETTGTTVAGCLFALAAHPEIQHKVYEEIYQVFGEDDRPAHISDFEKLPYLEQVIKETQRLFTTIPVIIRQTQSDTKIGPHIYPAGTSVMVNFGGVHHNPKLYPNPYRFNPENFSSESIKNRHPCSFVPFSKGARNCIGKILADISMKLILTAMLRTFIFRTTKKVENVKLKPGIVECFASGYPLSITLRKKLS